MSQTKRAREVFRYDAETAARLLATLTKRQAAVACLVAKGTPFAQIATRLGIKLADVRNRLVKVKRKLHCTALGCLLYTSPSPRD